MDNKVSILHSDVWWGNQKERRGFGLWVAVFTSSVPQFFLFLPGWDGRRRRAVPFCYRTESRHTCTFNSLISKKAYLCSFEIPGCEWMPEYRQTGQRTRAGRYRGEGGELLVLVSGFGTESFPDGGIHRRLWGLCWTWKWRHWCRGRNLRC